MTITTIEALLPHRGRMKLIDQILEMRNESAATVAIVTAEWPLVEQNVVSPLVLIELVAQTSGIAIGWKKLQRKESIDSRGWLVGIKKAHFKVEQIPLHTRITTYAQVQFKIENYTIIKGTSSIGTDVIADIILQVIQASDV
ncbi:hypothetical protein QUF90_15090 [Desulfococcaceae bacterium HSG9]|nr:hypothetical protein [Desulfococcaceae bacterium HSG9]